MREGIGQNITCRDFDTILEEIMLKNDKAVRHGRNVSKYIYPILKHLVSRGSPILNIEIYINNINNVNSIDELDTHHPCRT